MKLRPIAVFAALVLIFSAAVHAASNKTTINVRTPTVVGSYTLQPGEYAVEWNGSGPDIQVTFLKGNKMMVTVPAALEPPHSRQEVSFSCRADESGAIWLVEIKTKNATLRFLPKRDEQRKLTLGHRAGQNPVSPGAARFQPESDPAGPPPGAPKTAV